MQLLTIAGNVGNVKDIREAGGEKVLNFSIAVDQGKDKHGEKRDPLWVDCALWGKRAESLAPYIAKGSKLAVSGRPTVREHEGKAYLGCTVSELTFMSSKSDNEARGATREESETRQSETKSNYSVDTTQYPDDSEIPF